MRYPGDIPFQTELVRKAIHLLSLSIPLGYIFVSRYTALTILVPLMAAFLLVDISMHIVPAVRRIFLQLFGSLLRPHELATDRLFLNGATYVLISACLCIAIFPKAIAVTAFAVLILSDIASAIVGKLWGRTLFLDKSAEGSLAFFLVGCAVVVVLGLALKAPWSYFVSGIAGVVGGTLAEAGSIRLRMDDNLSIPLSIGATMWILAWIAEHWWKSPFLHVLP